MSLNLLSLKGKLMSAGFAGVVSAPHSVLALVSFGAGSSVVLSPDLAFTVCSPVETRETIRCFLVRHPWSWLASTSVLGFRFKHLLLCQFSAAPEAGGASSVTGVGRGGKSQGKASLAIGTWRSSVETQWKLVLRAWCVLGGARVCTIQHKHTVRAGSGPL